MQELTGSKWIFLMAALCFVTACGNGTDTEKQADPVAVITLASGESIEVEDWTFEYIIHYSVRSEHDLAGGDVLIMDNGPYMVEPEDNSLRLVGETFGELAIPQEELEEIVYSLDLAPGEKVTVNSAEIRTVSGETHTMRPRQKYILPVDVMHFLPVKEDERTQVRVTEIYLNIVRNDGQPLKYTSLNLNHAKPYRDRAISNIRFSR